MQVQVLAKAKILGCPIDAGYIKGSDGSSSMVVYGKPDPARPAPPYTIGQLLHGISEIVKDVSGNEGLESKIKSNLPQSMLDLMYGPYKYTKSAYDSLLNSKKIDKTDTKLKKLLQILDPDQCVNTNKTIDPLESNNTVKKDATWKIHTDYQNEILFLAEIKSQYGENFDNIFNNDLKSAILMYADTASKISIQLNEIFFVKKGNDASEYAIWLQINSENLTADWPISVESVSIKIYDTNNTKILTEMKISDMANLLEYGKSTAQVQKESKTESKVLNNTQPPVQGSNPTQPPPQGSH
jgi:hypothetical protein